MARTPRDNHRGIAVLLALVACGALNAIHLANERSRGHDPVTGLVRDAALVPAQTATVRVSRWFKTNVVSLFQGPRLAHQNRELRAKVLALSVANKQLADAQAENDRLRALLDFERKSPKPLLAAEVTALKPSPQTDTVVLNRGIVDGVHLHSIVLASNGALVGQVIDVSAHSATALMLTDANSGVGAQIVPSGAAGKPASGNEAPKTVEASEHSSTTPPAKPADAASESQSGAEPSVGGQSPSTSSDPRKPVGLCQGRGAGKAWLTYLRSDAEIKPGDSVTTSGLGKDFPAGIPIGYVVAVTTDYTRSMKSATIRPAADLDHLLDDQAFIIR